MFHTESWIWSGLVFDKFLHPEFIQGWDQFYDISYMFFFSVGIYLWDKWGEVTEKKELLEKEVKQSELKFLKSQLSPHFLFNTLNTIYGLSIYNNPNTATAIRELKTTLNYIEKYNSKEGVVLESEIENLKSYIAINNLRFDNDVKFKIEVENPALKIEPMLFLPFIENAFKHGDNKSDSDIIIELEQKKDYLKFKIINDFSGEKRKDTVSGVGVENVKKRLSILYPNAKIAIQNSGNKFSVFIHLKGLVK
jgi:two-component system LytT family sensor kinase